MWDVGECYSALLDKATLNTGNISYISVGKSTKWEDLALKIWKPLSRSTPPFPAHRFRAFTWSTTIKRVGFLLKVRQDLLDEYKAHHQNVWPEMLDALRRNGWRNYSLFAREDGLLFGYFEADDDFEASLEGMSKECRRRK